MADLYNNVQKQGNRKRKDVKLVLTIIIALLLLVIGTVFLSSGVIARMRYNAYLEDLSRCTVHAYSHGGVVVHDADMQFRAKGKDAYKVYQLVIRGTAGEPRLSVPEEEPDLWFDFGNGGILEVWEVILEDSQRSGKGVCIRFADENGKKNIYDTDRLQVSSFRNGFVQYYTKK